MENTVGVWRLKCPGPLRVVDDEEDCKVKLPTEAEEVYKALESIAEEAPNLFAKPTKMFPVKFYHNVSSIICFTRDWHNEESVRMAAEMIRSRVPFPYMMSYLKGEKPPQKLLYEHSPDGELYRNDDHGLKVVRKDEPPCKLPSEEYCEPYLYFPDGDNTIAKMSDPRGGKWIVFSSGEDYLKKHDAAYKALIPLCKQGILVGLKASTNVVNKANNSAVSGEGARRKDPAILCYTADGQDKEDVLKAVDAIRKAVPSEYMMFYKLNSASQNGDYYHEGIKCVTQYQHDAYGRLYERDSLRRFTLVNFQKGGQ